MKYLIKDEYGDLDIIEIEGDITGVTGGSCGAYPKHEGTYIVHDYGDGRVTIDDYEGYSAKEDKDYWAEEERDITIIAREDEIEALIYDDGHETHYVEGCLTLSECRVKYGAYTTKYWRLKDYILKED